MPSNIAPQDVLKMLTTLYGLTQADKGTQLQQQQLDLQRNQGDRQYELTKARYGQEAADAERMYNLNRERNTQQATDAERQYNLAQQEIQNRERLGTQTGLTDILTNLGTTPEIQNSVIQAFMDRLNIPTPSVTPTPALPAGIYGAAEQPKPKTFGQKYKDFATKVFPYGGLFK